MPRKKVVQGSDGADDGHIEMLKLGIQNTFPAVVVKNESFVEYANRVQRMKFADGLVVTKITHPEITEPHIYQGMFGGFHVEPGPVGVVWSDGSTE